MILLYTCWKKLGIQLKVERQLSAAQESPEHSRLRYPPSPYLPFSQNLSGCLREAI